MTIKENVLLAPYTTFGVGGSARYFCEPASVEELREAIKFGTNEDTATFILGGGSNIVISDEGFEGLVIQPTILGIEFEDTDDGVMISVGSGEEWDAFVSAAVAQDLYGVECASGIPGRVGAAVIGNIAAYGQAVSDTIVDVEVIDRNDPVDTAQVLQKNALGLVYRGSDFQSKKLEDKIIVGARFLLQKEKTGEFAYESARKVAEELGLGVETPAQRRKVVLEARHRVGSLLEQTAHGGCRTAGSFFKNPEVDMRTLEELVAYDEFGISKEKILEQNKVHTGSNLRVPAALVLLAAGFTRGQQWNNVRLHPDHVLKIQNMGGAHAQEIHDVCKEIVTTVKNKLGVTLEPEIRFVGNFT